MACRTSKRSISSAHAPGAPLVAFFHGGYWRARDKDDFSFIAAGLVPHGITLACINYGLAPQTPLREIVAQSRRALAWLAVHSTELEVNATQISVLGHSAGGHLAAMCAVASPVRSVVSLSGLHDLIPIQRSFANEWLQLDAKEAHALSPIHHSPANACALYVTAGERESSAFKTQGRALLDAWTANGCRGEYVDSPGDNHFTICERLGDPADALTQKVVALAS